MLQITMIKEIYDKKENTKKRWELINSERYTIDEKQYNNIVSSAPFFRRLGGSVIQLKNYTCNGYKVVKDISTSPNKEIKTIRRFKFNWID